MHLLLTDYMTRYRAYVAHLTETIEPLCLGCHGPRTSPADTLCRYCVDERTYGTDVRPTTLDSTGRIRYLDGTLFTPQEQTK